MYKSGVTKIYFETARDSGPFSILVARADSYRLRAGKMINPKLKQIVSSRSYHAKSQPGQCMLVVAVILKRVFLAILRLQAFYLPVLIFRGIKLSHESVQVAYQFL